MNSIDSKPKVLVFAPNYIEFLSWIGRKTIIHSQITTMTYETKDQVFQYCNNPEQIKGFDKSGTQIFILKEKYVSQKVLSHISNILNKRPLKKFQEHSLTY